jgi:hypothetical protein
MCAKLSGAGNPPERLWGQIVDELPITTRRYPWFDKAKEKHSESASNVIPKSQAG